jgi:Copper type II ascorbate-dependent monooxygenase, C-terminal domain
MRWLVPGLLLGTASFAADPTFNRDVLPILQKNCQICHRPGEIAPMPFLTYEETRPWAKAIKVAVATGKMPPWYADPRYGHFVNDRRLNAGEVQRLVSWVDAGAPEGEPQDKPAPVAWKDGWNIRPDEIFQMPDAFPIPAKGTLDYVYIVIPTGFTKDTWVTAAEVRPSAPSVVHHAIAVIRPPGSQWMKDAKPFVPYVPPMPAGEDDPQTKPVDTSYDTSYEYLAGYSPGMQPQRFDADHSAKLIPAHSDIVLQVHYTPNGKSAVADQTKIGLAIAPEPPPKRFMSAVAASANWTIPPGDPNFEARAKLTFGEPVELVSLQPHMHLRGKDMTIRVTYPSGETETLLSVPHYDFHWQIVYYLEKPLRLPQGTRVEVTAHWDNSAGNPQNPDPAAAVRYGFQSSEEMLSAAMGVIIDRD